MGGVQCVGGKEVSGLVNPRTVAEASGAGQGTPELQQAPPSKAKKAPKLASLGQTHTHTHTHTHTPTHTQLTHTHTHTYTHTYTHTPTHMHTHTLLLIISLPTLHLPFTFPSDTICCFGLASEGATLITVSTPSRCRGPGSRLEATAKSHER